MNFIHNDIRGGLTAAIPIGDGISSDCEVRML